MYDEKFILYIGDNEKSTPTDSTNSEDSFEIDYSEIEKSMYNALRRLENERQVQEMSKAINEDSDLVEFSSSTDAEMFTGSSVAAADSTAQQQTIYLLDIRNILTLFLLIYFILNVYSRIKNSLSSYFKSE